MSCEDCSKKQAPTDSIAEAAKLWAQVGQTDGFLRGVEWAIRAFRMQYEATLPKIVRARALATFDRIANEVIEHAKTSSQELAQPTRSAAEAMTRRLEANTNGLHQIPLRIRLRSAIKILTG